jgi:hypothetical protein
MENESRATIVTAFIANVNNISYRNTEKYIAYGKKLLEIPVPKIVFIDTESYDTYFSSFCDEHTHFIVFNLSDMYFEEYKHLITDFDLVTDNKSKDTMEYMFVQCYKTEWVRKAIEMDIYKTDQFIWIDFGIYHMVNDDSIFENAILNISKKSYSKLRISSFKPHNYVCTHNVYKRITWNFAGSIFGGDKKSLITFADIVKDKVIETIEKKNTIMWEICIWYLVKNTVPDLFDCYIYDHHNSYILRLY